MVEDHIKQYVKERLKAGVPRSHIEEVLAVMGLTKEEIAEAFKFDEVEKSSDMEDLFTTSIESSTASKSTLMETAPEKPSEEKSTKKETVEKPVKKPVVAQPIEEVKPIKPQITKPVAEEPTAEPPKIEPLGEAKEEKPHETTEPLEKPIIEPLSEREKEEPKKEEKKEEVATESVTTPKQEITKPNEVASSETEANTSESISETSVPHGFVEYIGKEEKKPVEVPPVTPTKQFAGYKPVPVSQMTTTHPQEISKTEMSSGESPPEKQEASTQEQPKAEMPEKPKIETVQQPVARPSQTISTMSTVQTPKAESQQPEEKKGLNLKLLVIPIIIIIIVGGIGGFFFLSVKQQPEPQTGMIPKPTAQIKKISASCDAIEGKLIITNKGTLSINTREDGLTILVSGETYEDTSGRVIPPGNSTEYGWDIIRSLGPGAEGVVFGDTIPVTNFTC